jgi:hypothetical protein
MKLEFPKHCCLGNMRNVWERASLPKSSRKLAELDWLIYHGSAPAHINVFLRETSRFDDDTQSKGVTAISHI